MGLLKPFFKHGADRIPAQKGSLGSQLYYQHEFGPILPSTGFVPLSNLPVPLTPNLLTLKTNMWQ